MSSMWPTEARTPRKEGWHEPDAAEIDLAVLRTIAYADVFDYPLAADEVHRYLVGVPATAGTVQASLRAQVGRGEL
ncbi:MAG: hypothetical protein ACRDIB_14755, partial [Ardenticatenaceae bacterium]